MEFNKLMTMEMEMMEKMMMNESKRKIESPHTMLGS